MPTTFPTEALVKALKSLLKIFDDSTLSKGEAYFNKGAVSPLKIHEDIIRGTVDGSGAASYTIEIDTQDKNISCSCPVHGPCKHLAAATLKALQDLRQTSPLEIPQHITLWLEALNKPADLVQSNPLDVGQDFRTLYILSKHDVSVCITELNKNGSYKKNKETLISKDNLFHLPPDKKALLSDEDWDLMLLMAKNTTSQSRFVLDFPEAATLLEKIVKTDRCHYDHIHSETLTWGEPLEGQFDWVVDAQGMQSLNCQVKNEKIAILSDLRPLCYIQESLSKVGILSVNVPEHLIKPLLSSPKISPSHASLIRTQFPKGLAPKELAPKGLAFPAPKEVVIRELKGHLPTPCLRFFIEQPERQYYGTDETLCAKLSFDYDGHRLSSMPKKEIMGGILIQEKEGFCRIYRNIAAENRAIDLLNHYQMMLNYHDTFKLPCDPTVLPNEIIHFLYKVAPKLKEEGFRIEISADFPVKVVHDSPEWYGETTPTENNWFDFEMGVMIEGKRINLLPALAKMASSMRAHGIPPNDYENDQMISIPIDNQEVILIPASRIKRILEIFLDLSFAKSLDTDGLLKVSSWESTKMADLAEAMQATLMRWHGPQELQKKGAVLKTITAIPAATLPTQLNCTLRPYQQEGFNWLQFLRIYELSGILADDMGLGKTIQALTHILKEKEEGRLKNPCLVIAPTSLMNNWFLEAQKFTPSLKCLILQGTSRKEHFDKLQEYDLILTTYPLLAHDKEILLAQSFHLLILDEAQNIKNSKTIAHSIIAQLQVNHRLCLTGTPMENHLGELWSLFDFLMPGFLGDEKTFSRAFRKPIEKEGNLYLRKVLAERINPFMLRRTKEQVVLELPEKNEILCSIELTKTQQDLYEAIRLTMHDKVQKEIEKKGFERSHIILLEALLRLRQVCCDPRLLEDREHTPEDSAKLQYLLEILPSMIAEGRQILIFSQFTSMLSLIIESLTIEKIPFTLLTGDTTDRLKPVQDFQNGKVPLMLISLKAGGVGLNLTAADTVIHFDPWWNPAVEDQATARAHRIGQTKIVFVYKFITAGTVEEKILQLQKRKKELVAGLLDAKFSGQFDLSLQDLDSLFATIRN